ncbi:MAG: hypothetical protein JRE43_12370 [Deltaproteobacteria bacterium]|jgi:hypothetical protein|nr:hypothetical protein [Deltaproteobacteria bacterium]
MPALLLAGLIAIGGMLWRSETDPQILFLRHPAEARWIRAARPLELQARGASALSRTAEFRVGFELAAQRPSGDPAPELILQTLRAVVVKLDGRVLYDDQAREPQINWRVSRRVTLPADLDAGRHELEFVVSNPAGPPLLLAYCEALALRSGSGWNSRFGGGDWAAALDADELPAPELTGTFPRVSEAFGSLAPWLAAVFLTAAGLSLAWERRWRPAALSEVKWSSGLFASFIALAWCVLLLNNLPKLPPAMGMDARGHVEYMEYLNANLAIPLASDGWQMFQPPLYYALSVLYARPLSGMLSSDWFFRALALLPMLSGLVTVVLCHRVSRAIFPQRADLRTIATCVGGFLPMVLFFSQSLGNEPLAAMWSAWAIALGVEALRNPALAIDTRKQLSLGLALGLGLLTKVSVLLLVPPLLAAGIAALRQAGASWRAVAAAIARVGGVCALVSGWYYIRNWIRLGHPFVGGWDQARGISWWQDPGYRTWEQYLSFGESLTRPIYAGTNGLWDGLHSTMWLDGMLSGKTLEILPPWNFAPMLAGAWLGLFPLALILLGAGRAIARAARGENDGLTFCAVSLFLGLIAVIWISLTVPTFSSIKATYLLGFLPCFGALAASGYDTLARQSWQRALLVGGIGCWAVFAYVAYFAIG